MAAKSDFAQKLLHDLRLRKERMSVSKSSARDAYRNPGHVQRGSRQTKSLESIGGPKMAKQQQMYGGAARAPTIKESSQQIVSYGGGRHQRSRSIGDLPVAFTYAVKNGGKLLNVDFSGSGNTNTIIDFFHQIGRGSLDTGNTRNQTSLVKHHPSNKTGVVVPALTAAQIKEISKGVHNLYEIIRSSSNGMNMGRHSMEVGKELLKGAKGLEESLRMLVNLQEASELMISPNQKSRIQLLEVDEDDRADDRSKIMDQNQVALPRFSFDKPSKRSDSSSMLSTHRRSTSYGDDIIRSISTASNVKNMNNSSHSEKGRISNVIAKLMGLEEVPRKIESQSTRDESRLQVNKTLKSTKDGVALLKDQKLPHIQETDKNRVPSPTRTTNVADMKESKNNRLDQHRDQKQDRPLSCETKEKMQHKRRSVKALVNLQHGIVEKKKTSRKDKSNEIKLVPRYNQTKEPEKKTSQNCKPDSKQIKQVKPRVLPLKEPHKQPSDQNLIPTDATLKAEESKPERTEGNVEEKSVTRNKVDSMMVRRTEAPLKEEAAMRRNGTRILKNLGTPSNHKLSIFKETQRKDTQQSVPFRSKSEETNNTRSNPKKPQEKIQVNDTVPICENDIKIDPQETLKVVGKHVDSIKRSVEARNVSENKFRKSLYSGIVILTEHEKQLKEILIKDQLFLSTTEALFNFNIPVGFLDVDDHNHHNEETKLKLECGYEILRRKARNQELLSHPYMKLSICGTPIRYLDELVKQLYKDLESLKLYGRNTCNEYNEVDCLHYMLEKDIYNKNSDINSFWDFGWHIMTFTFVEKSEFVNDVEQDVLQRLVDEMVNDMLSTTSPF